MLIVTHTLLIEITDVVLIKQVYMNEYIVLTKLFNELNNGFFFLKQTLSF